MSRLARFESGRHKGFLARLRGDRRGVSAVEFALLAPLMIGFYFGLTEFCQGYMAQKRMGHTTSAIGDLVAQTDVVTKDQLEDIFGIGAMIMRPFGTADLTTRISSVTRDANGVTRVDWSQAKGSSPRAVGSIVTVPDDLIATGESLVMSESTYDYKSPIQYLMPAVTQFSSSFYLRPRRVEKVTCTDCPTT